MTLGQRSLGSSMLLFPTIRAPTPAAGAAHLLHGLADGGQRRGAQRGKRHIVETNDRAIVGHLATGMMHGLPDCAQCREIVKGQHRSELDPSIDHRCDKPEAFFETRSGIDSRRESRDAPSRER